MSSGFAHIDNIVAICYRCAMNLKDWIAKPERRRALLGRVPISAAYLRQIATGWQKRQPSPGLARMIEAATGGKVARWELRPDVFDKPKRKR